MALDDSNEERGHLQVDRRQLSKRLREALAVRPDDRHPARLTFDGKSLCVALEGAKFRADATGTWEGEVLIATEVLRKLGKNLGRGKESILLSTDGKELRFGITIVPCEWNPCCQAMELPLGAPCLKRDDHDAEIILNLWYVHDDAGLIYSLRIRPYVGTGTDDEKLAMLNRLANLDYLIARPFPIPERFHLEIEEDGKRQRLPVAPHALLSALDSPIALFAEAIKQIEAELPAQTELSISHAPLFCSTALLADDSGRLYSGRQILRMSHDEEVIEVMEPTWALIVAFMADHGWRPSASTDSFLRSNCAVTEEDALALASAGKAVILQALKDPRSIQLRFDVAKLAEIVDFASAGGFAITR